MKALLEFDPRYGLPAVKALSDDTFGPDHLRWVDAPPGTSVGDVLRPDGTFGPHEPPMDDLRALRLRDVKCDCRNAITGGFPSSALGAEHRYGSSDTDRENIDRAAMAALKGQSVAGWTAQLQCAADGEAPALAAHTAAQVHQVSSDLHAFIEAARIKLADLNGKIGAATTAAALQAITWA